MPSVRAQVLATVARFEWTYIGYPVRHTKAVCAWLLGGIPVMCCSAYRGLAEWIDVHGIGFVVDSIEEVGALTQRLDDIGRATRACLEQRHLLPTKARPRDSVSITGVCWTNRWMSQLPGRESVEPGQRTDKRSASRSFVEFRAPDPRRSTASVGWTGS